MKFIYVENALHLARTNFRLLSQQPVSTTKVKNFNLGYSC